MKPIFPRPLTLAFGATFVLALVSTFGDWLWTHYIPDGAIVPGVLHGFVIFLVLAAVLAWEAGTGRALRRLLPSLPAAGLAIAAIFYPIAGLVGYLPALLVTWILMWVSVALLQRWAKDSPESVARALGRATLAAIFSGLAFAAISGIWTRPNPDGPNYLWHFLCWGFAFLPGFLALFVPSPKSFAPPEG